MLYHTLATTKLRINFFVIPVGLKFGTWNLVKKMSALGEFALGTVRECMVIY